MRRRAVGWAEPVRQVMTSLQPPLLRQPDETATVAWQPGFLYLKSTASGDGPRRVASQIQNRDQKGGEGASA